MSSPSVSVVVPTYNAPLRLKRTLDTVLAQTVAAHQVVVVDDGSTDATPSVCAAFGSAIVYRRVANGGQQRARNLGVDLASGDWIALLDHDDLWHPDYLAELAAFLADHGEEADMTVCESRTVREQGGHTEIANPGRMTLRAPPGYWTGMGADPTARWSVLPRWDHPRYLAFHPAQPSSTALRASFYRGIGGFDPRMRGSLAENFEFEIRALRTARVGILWRPLVDIVEHGANLTADSARMAMDLADCLTFVQTHHGLSAEQTGALDIERQRRLPDAIAGAFVARDFAKVREYMRMLTVPKGAKLRIKGAISALPPWLARLVADLSIR